MSTKKRNLTKKNRLATKANKTKKLIKKLRTPKWKRSLSKTAQWKKRNMGEQQKH